MTLTALSMFGFSSILCSNSIYGTLFSIGFSEMTMDQSLKVKAGAIKTRNVLTRAERVARLKELGKFDENADIVGMPKVRVQKVSLKRKKKVKKVDEEK